MNYQQPEPTQSPAQMVPVNQTVLVRMYPRLLASVELALRRLIAERDCYYDGCEVDPESGTPNLPEDVDMIRAMDRDIEELHALIAEAKGGHALQQPTERTSSMSYMTDGLTFNTLRGANTARLPQFKNRLGQLAHSKADGSDWTPAQWLQAVVGELGEYANERKKFERGDMSAEVFRDKAAAELADVMIYLDILAMQLDIDLGKATIDKFNLVSRRVDCDVMIRVDGSDWHHSTPKKPTLEQEAEWRESQGRSG